MGAILEFHQDVVKVLAELREFSKEANAAHINRKLIDLELAIGFLVNYNGMLMEKMANHVKKKEGEIVALKQQLDFVERKKSVDNLSVACTDIIGQVERSPPDSHMPWTCEDNCRFSHLELQCRKCFPDMQQDGSDLNERLQAHLKTVCRGVSQTPLSNAIHYKCEMDLQLLRLGYTKCLEELDQHKKQSEESLALYRKSEKRSKSLSALSEKRFEDVKIYQKKEIDIKRYLRILASDDSSEAEVSEIGICPETKGYLKIISEMKKRSTKTPQVLSQGKASPVQLVHDLSTNDSGNGEIFVDLVDTNALGTKRPRTNRNNCASSSRGGIKADARRSGNVSNLSDRAK